MRTREVAAVDEAVVAERFEGRLEVDLDRLLQLLVRLPLLLLIRLLLRLGSLRTLHGLRGRSRRTLDADFEALDGLVVRESWLDEGWREEGEEAGELEAQVGKEGELEEGREEEGVLRGR